MVKVDTMEKLMFDVNTYKHKMTKLVSKMTDKDVECGAKLAIREDDVMLYLSFHDVDRINPEEMLGHSMEIQIYWSVYT